MTTPTLPCHTFPHRRELPAAPPCRLNCGSEHVERVCACCGASALALSCRWWEHGNPAADVDEGEPGSDRAGLVLCWECACEFDCLRVTPQPVVAETVPEGRLFA